MLELLLYRLSMTLYRDRFVLKGAMLMSTWFDAPFRPNFAISNLLGFGDDAPASLLTAFRDIVPVEVDDGVEFDVDGLTVDRMVTTWTMAACV